MNIQSQRLPLPICRGFGIEMHPMKTFFTSLLLVAATLMSRAALPQPDLVAQIHFAGGANIAADKNYNTFAPQFSSAEAKTLRAQTADKLAKFFASWLAQTTGAMVNSGSARLRPLLEELQNNEWQLEARNVNGKIETTLALKTGDAGAQTCQTALKPFFPAATFERANGWIVFRTSAAAPKIADNLSALNGAWLTLDLNWPTLGNYFPGVRQLGLPETKFSVSTGATDFKIDGKFLFPGNITAPMDAWRIPTNTLHQPFISFTAARGLSAWLDSQPWTREFHLNPTPNQIYFWALPQIPWQVFAAIPCADSAATLLEVYDNLANAFNAAKSKNGMAFPCTVEQTNRQVTVVGLPFVAPYFEAVKSSAGEFLLAAGFPNTPRSSKPLPRRTKPCIRPIMSSEPKRN